MVYLATVGASAQIDYNVSRATQRADQVKRATVRLADGTMQDLMRSMSNSRSDIQAALRAQQVDASATLLVELIRHKKPGQDLKEVAAELTELTRQLPSYSGQAGQWRTVQTAIADFNRELFNTAPGPYPGPPERPIVGRVSWRGVVDDRVQLVIRGRSIETKTIEGKAFPDGVVNFTTAFPASVVAVDVTKLSGRGTVTVLQQPSRTNEFTAVIEIYDRASGEQEYRLDIFWRQ
jgi:hypothetical protein